MKRRFAPWLNPTSMKGFSLLEIMVVVAIISIMAGTVVVGFNSFGETVRTRETAGVITDTIKNLELEMIRREFVKQTVNFEEGYLVVEAQVENQSEDMILEWEGPNGNCEELKITNPLSGTPVYLAQRDAEDNNMQIDAITDASKTVPVCFADSDETEWRYQLFKGADRSQVIRFIHFNIRRGSTADYARIADGTDYTLEITAPYASKEIFEIDPNTKEKIPVTQADLTIQNGGDPVEITLQ